MNIFFEWPRLVVWAVVAAFMLAGSSAALAETDQEKYERDGAVRLSDAELRDVLVGNTTKGKGWAVYYNPNGAKVAYANGNVSSRKWRFSGDGKFCEELMRSGREICSPRVYRYKDMYLGFKPDGTLVAQYSVVEGNPEGL